MHSVLFVAVIPEVSGEAWEKFVERAKLKTQQDKSALRLAENVWLLNLQESVAPLGWLVAAAEMQQVSYTILPFESAPQWLPAGFDPGTIWGRNAG